MADGADSDLPRRGRLVTRLLASVRDAREAGIALDGGADLIDLKEPACGALGALPLALVREIVAAIDGARPVSATIGDLPMKAALLAHAVREMSATGVDFVKIGFFPGEMHPCIRALAPLARETALIAVLFADCDPDLALLGELAAAGFRGAMLDTTDKRGGGLRSRMDDGQLRGFVAAARSRGLLVGLAGSLGAEDIPPLLALAPDYLGFRGALCGSSGRSGALEAAAFRGIRLQFANSGAESSNT